jgi:hypothetical protein
MPTIECGATFMLVESEELARELAGLMNWCDVREKDLAGEAG